MVAKLDAPALTRPEYDVLVRAAKGDSTDEIAQASFLAPTTVKSCLQSALKKLAARNGAEAVAKLAHLGLP